MPKPYQQSTPKPPAMSSTSEPRSPIFDLLHLDNYYPIARTIYHFLPIADIVAISKTCKSLQNVYRSLVPLEWDMDRTLSRFVSNPKRLRLEMAKCSALIAGDVPLQFFERTSWQECTLDIYVHDKQEKGIIKYLQDWEAYKEPKIKCKSLGQDSLPACQYVMERDKIVSKATVIRVIQTSRVILPIHAILESSVSTATTNIFSWNMAFALFPLTTFVHHHAFLTRKRNKWFVIKNLKKYEALGWDMPLIFLPPAEQNSTNFPIRPIRRVGDRYTWTIAASDRAPLDVHVETQPDYVLEYCNFSCTYVEKWRPQESRVRVHHYNLVADTYQPCMLKYQYTIGRNGWPGFLRKILQYKTLEQLHMIDPAQRPHNFSHLVEMPQDIDEEMEIFSKPDSWRYCDEEIPHLYREWEQSSVGSCD